MYMDSASTYTYTYTYTYMYVHMYKLRVLQLCHVIDRDISLKFQILLVPLQIWRYTYALLICLVRILYTYAFIFKFYVGKRTCLGEALARNSFYLFVTALAKMFEFKPVPDELLPSLTPVHGFTLSPHPFNAVVSVRQCNEYQEFM